jgi:hypothetical protein
MPGYDLSNGNGAQQIQRHNEMAHRLKLLTKDLGGPKELRCKDFKHQSKHAEADDKPD